MKFPIFCNETRLESSENINKHTSLRQKLRRDQESCPHSFKIPLTWWKCNNLFAIFGANVFKWNWFSKLVSILIGPLMLFIKVWKLTKKCNYFIYSSSFQVICIVNKYDSWTGVAGVENWDTGLQLKINKLLFCFNNSFLSKCSKTPGVCLMNNGFLTTTLV